MKNQALTTLTLISGCLFTITITAQPVLTYSNNAPQPGEVYVSYLASTTPATLAVSTNGANTNWDFSNIGQFSGGTILTHWIPNMTQFGNLYPNATVMCQEPQWGTNMIYLQADSTQLLEVGLNDMVWDNPRTRITYPFTFNDVYADTATYVPYNWIWHITGAADGYGTVKLPYGTVNNVLHVSETINYYNGIGWVPEQFYFWYQENTHTPICFYYTDATNEYFYFREPVFVIGMDEHENIKPVIYPNPFSGQVFVSVPDIKFEKFKLSLLDLTGKLIYEENILQNTSQTISKDFSFLNGGIYQILLQSETRVYRGDLIKM